MLGIIYPLVLQLAAIFHEDAGFHVARQLGDNSTPTTDEELVITHHDFREKLRGKKFDHWSDLKEALGKKAQQRTEPDVDGGVRLMSGLSVAFVIILNVLVWTVVAYVMTMMEGWGSRAQGWIVFTILCVYGLGVYAYCQYAYEHPHLRLITNFLFGLVPLTVSCASYVLALLGLDLVRATTRDNFEKNIFDRMKPWEEEFDGRLIFFLAVLPGLIVSIYLGNTVSTGFKAAATYFDVLSLCLFIDVGRFAGHFSYLVAREWSIGKSPTSISSRPGLAYVVHVVCLAWYLMLVRLEAGRTTVILADGTKTRTLVSLTSYVFFPLSLYLGYMNLREFFDQFEIQRKWLEALGNILMVFVVAVFMLLVAVVFNTIEPNMMGIGGLLFCVFYGAYSMSQGQLLGFILAMVPLALVAYGAAVLSTTYAQAIRQGILAHLVQ